MFREKTLFVVGAGASQEVGLPVGGELKEVIARKLAIKFEMYQPVSGDLGILDALRVYAKESGDKNGDVNPYLHAGRQISGAMPQAISIDNFIHDHQSNHEIEICGKLAIVRSILEAESNCQLHVDPGNIYNTINFERIKDTWYTKFFQRLHEQQPKRNLAYLFENVSFIIFNYDRCIEHFLYYALQNYYGVESSQTAKLLETLEIFHPYGTVGSLPWQEAQGAIPFGSHTQSGDRLLTLAAQIKTFTERLEDAPTLSAMRRLVCDAQAIVFLGFAFHPQNLELIDPDRETNVRNIFATTKGISDSDCPVVKGQLEELIHKKKTATNFHMKNGLTCSELFSEYWRSLMM